MLEGSNESGSEESNNESMRKRKRNGSCKRVEPRPGRESNAQISLALVEIVGSQVEISLLRLSARS